MSICPFAVQKPVSAHGGAIGTILGVVIHVTAGEGDPYNEFANPKNQVSSHFGILNGQGGTVDGTIEQYVDTGFDSWAQMGGNHTYISVETEGEPGDPLTPAQVEAFGRLYAWLHSAHGVPFVIIDTPGQRGFITHGDGGAAWGNHIDCPGPSRKAQRRAVLNAAQGNTPPAPTPGSNAPGGKLAMVTYDYGYAVRITYLDLLFREPDAGGFATDVAYLAAGGTLNQMTTNIQDSAEGKVVLNAKRRSIGLGPASIEYADKTLADIEPWAGMPQSAFDALVAPADDE